MRQIKMIRFYMGRIKQQKRAAFLESNVYALRKGKATKKSCTILDHKIKYMV